MFYVYLKCDIFYTKKNKQHKQINNNFLYDLY